ncbi:coiled-coil domain-containing protein [Microvirga roseola]|uniref:hypothetical protein n=1 Tax=Microvirga roseola TaxID=2883126 RepID=UPI001E61AF21|nr:hypothetical protein [Microvirga roseola]
MAVAAALGWIVAIWSLTSSASEERELSQRIQELQASRAAVVSQLEELRRTGGSLASLQEQITTGQQNLEQLRLQQEQVQAALARTPDLLGPAEQRLSDLQAQIEARSVRMAELQSEANSIASQVEQARQELTAVQQSIGMRTQELASVGERLVMVRQEESDARQELSRLTAASADKVAEMGIAERRLQEAREAEAQAQRNLAAVRESLAELQRSRTETARIVDEMTASRNQVLVELQQAQEQSTTVQRQLAEVIDQLTARRNELMAIDQRLQGGASGALAGQPGQADSAGMNKVKRLRCRRQPKGPLDASRPRADESAPHLQEALPNSADPDARVATSRHPAHVSPRARTVGNASGYSSVRRLQQVEWLYTVAANTKVPNSGTLRRSDIFLKRLVQPPLIALTLGAGLASSAAAQVGYQVQPYPQAVRPLAPGVLVGAAPSIGLRD